MKYRLCFPFLFTALVLIPAALFGQGKTITGKVTSAGDNITLPGVNIIIKGTSIGTISEADGTYSIPVASDDATLVFSFIGFLNQEVTVKGKTSIDIALVEDITALDEVVVIGYGQVQKSDITGAISSVSSEDLIERPVSSLSMAIQGRAAGVQITSTTGAPGGGTSIRIRGHGSLTSSNSPLWVIDGYIGGSAASLAPEDIESIEILKDNASTAIYGARGANGVIIVTTKQGKANETQVSFTHYTEMRSVIKKMDLLNASEFMTLRNQALANDGFPAQYSEGEINLTEPVASTGYIADTDWQDIMFKKAYAHYYNLSFSGGSENTKYALSANHKTEEGTIPYSSYKSSGLNLNLSHKLGKKVDIGASIKAYQNKIEGFMVVSGSSWANGPAGNALLSVPYYPVYDSTGNYYTNNIWDNPLYAAEGELNDRVYTGASGSFYMNYKPFESLTIKASLSGSLNSNLQNRFITSGLNEATMTQKRALAYVNQSNSDHWLANIVASYDKTFEQHHVGVMVGIEQQASNTNHHGINAAGLSKESLLYYNLGAFDVENNRVYSGFWGTAYSSQFTRLSYDFAGKYLFSGTLRRDGSSKFGDNNKYGFFPSFSAAWKLHHEGFIADLGIFNQLKLRASWGQSGNDNISLYQWQPEISYTVAHSSAIFDDAIYQGAVISKIPNSSIGWETSTTMNIGLDMSFFRNRLNVSIDAYDKNTTDLLWDDLLPLYTGYGNGWQTSGVKVTTNFAEMNNRGIEFVIGGTVVDKNDWFVDLSFNFAKNINEVKNIGEQEGFETGVTLVEPGQPIGNIYGYKTEGLYSIQDSINGAIPAGSGLRPGDQKYADMDENGVINGDDRTIIGNALPDFTSGMNIRVGYKGFELSALITSMYGNDMYNGAYSDLTQGDIGRANGLRDLKDAWSPENQSSTIPRLSTTYTTLTSDRFVEDASFVKLSNLMLSYNLPASLLGRINIESFRVYVSGQNLLWLTSYRGYDPEQHSGGDSNLNLGYDNKNYPVSKAFTIGLNITF